MVKKAALIALFFLAAAPCYARYNSEYRRRELEREYGTDSPTWGMLSPADKAGTVVCGLLVLAVIAVYLRPNGKR